MKNVEEIPILKAEVTLGDGFAIASLAVADDKASLEELTKKLKADIEARKVDSELLKTYMGFLDATEIDLGDVEVDFYIDTIIKI